jgi:hypothetical protein
VTRAAPLRPSTIAISGRIAAMLVRICCALVLVLAPAVASADPAPTPAQLERAKQAFTEGRKLHDAGQLTEAIEKFKASYALSKNPVLLYNIGLTMEELGPDNLDLAVVFYRRFLAEAPAGAAQRRDATDRIAAITKRLTAPLPATPAPDKPPVPAATPPVPTATSPMPTATPPVPAATLPVPTPPASTRHGAADFTHQVVETAPPGAPLDVTAVVSEAAGFTVTLFLRDAGEATFVSTPMIQRGDERVGRIPAARMIGSAVQYYIEVRDATGALITRSGRSTSPNLITLDASARPRFYLDVADPVLPPPPPPPVDAEDPIARGVPRTGGASADPRDGDRDDRALSYARWGTTALAGTSLGVGITLYVLAHGHATALETDATGCGAPPCQKYDAYDRDLQRTGKLEQTISNVALIGGVAVAAVAGYLWVRALTSHREPARSTPAMSWQLAPSLGVNGYAGAAAAVRF